MRNLRTEAHRDKEVLIEDYSQQIAHLEAAVSVKDEEVNELYISIMKSSL